VRRSKPKTKLRDEDIAFVKQFLSEGVHTIITLNPLEFVLGYAPFNMTPTALTNALMKAEARGMEKAREKDSWLKWIIIAGIAAMMLAIAFYIIHAAITGGGGGALIKI
jgi:hypothetical protein